MCMARYNVSVTVLILGITSSPNFRDVLIYTPCLPVCGWIIKKTKSCCLYVHTRLSEQLHFSYQTCVVEAQLLLDILCTVLVTQKWDRFRYIIILRDTVKWWIPSPVPMQEWIMCLTCLRGNFKTGQIEYIKLNDHVDCYLCLIFFNIFSW